MDDRHKAKKFFVEEVEEGDEIRPRLKKGMWNVKAVTRGRRRMKQARMTGTAAGGLVPV